MEIRETHHYESKKELIHDGKVIDTMRLPIQVEIIREPSVDELHNAANKFEDQIEAVQVESRALPRQILKNRIAMAIGTSVIGVFFGGIAGDSFAHRYGTYPTYGPGCAAGAVGLALILGFMGDRSEASRRGPQEERIATELDELQHSQSLVAAALNSLDSSTEA